MATMGSHGSSHSSSYFCIFLQKVGIILWAAEYDILEKEFKGGIKMVHDIKFIQEVLRGLDAQTGNDTSDIPVEVDSWLDSFGIVAQYESYDYDEDFYPIGFKFSKAITKCDTEALVDTIKHEYAHYIHATVRKSQSAGKHDQEFKEIVISLGSTNYGQTCTAHIANQLAALK